MPAAITLSPLLGGDAFFYVPMSLIWATFVLPIRGDMGVPLHDDDPAGGKCGNLDEVDTTARKGEPGGGLG